MNRKETINAIILAGGKSERMDYPKPYLVYNNTTFIAKIISEYEKIGCSKVIVVINKDFYVSTWTNYLKTLSGKAEFLVNHFPKLERFYSVKLGIEAVQKNCDYCFIQNIDNPFVDQELLTTLIENRNENGFTLPVYQGKGGHPVLVSKKIIEYINERESIDLNLKNVLHLFDRREVKVNREDILFNINTPEDYNRIVLKKKIEVIQ